MLETLLTNLFTCALICSTVSVTKSDHDHFLSSYIILLIIDSPQGILKALLQCPNISWCTGSPVTGIISRIVIGTFNPAFEYYAAWTRSKLFAHWTVISITVHFVHVHPWCWYTPRCDGWYQCAKFGWMFSPLSLCFCASCRQSDWLYVTGRLGRESSGCWRWRSVVRRMGG